jgi:hypothetical protein
MKAVPAKIGAQPKQMAILGVLLVILLVVYLINRNPSPPESATASSRTATSPAPVLSNPGGPKTAPQAYSQPSGPMPMQRARGGVSSVDDFRPSLKLPEGADISRIDPTLKLDLLAKLRSAPLEGGSRSIFEFAQAPPPPPPKVAPIKPGPQVSATAKPATSAADAKPAPAPLPPIPLKFYGYVNSPRGATKRAFFVDGDDIFVAGENEMIRSRYKVIRIGINSAIVEDTTNNNQQTLPLIAELAG